MPNPEIQIRPATPEDQDFLQRMLMLALNWPADQADDDEAFEKFMVDDEVAVERLTGNFGNEHRDIGVIVCVGEAAIGACWLREFPRDEDSCPLIMWSIRMRQ